MNLITNTYYELIIFDFGCKRHCQTAVIYDVLSHFVHRVALYISFWKVLALILKLRL